jgi:hypothetical protein
MVLFLTAPAVQAQTEIAWKLVPGQSFELERSATQDQLVDVRGKSFKQVSAITWLVVFEVRDPDGDTSVLRATLKEVRHKLKGSVGAGQEHLLAEKLQGRQFTLRVTPQGRIVRLEGYTDFVNQASENQPERSRALRTLWPEESLREALADCLGPLPEKTAADATWQHEVRETLPHFGSLLTTRLGRSGMIASTHEYPYTIKTTYQAPAAADAPLFRIVKGALQGENGQGKIVFDAQRGRLLRHERRLTVRGTLTVEHMDMQVPLEFVSDNVLAIRIR